MITLKTALCFCIHYVSEQAITLTQKFQFLVRQDKINSFLNKLTLSVTYLTKNNNLFFCKRMDFLRQSNEHISIDIKEKVPIYQFETFTVISYYFLACLVSLIITTTVTPLFYIALLKIIYRETRFSDRHSKFNLNKLFLQTYLFFFCFL